MASNSPKITDIQLAAAIDSEMSTAQSEESDRLSRQRANAMEYYLGEPFGNEQADHSQVVTREVLDTIEWIKPELMKLFASGSETVRFEPQNEDDAPAAQQATDYINYLFHRKNEGFKILYQWITDGLLQKNGVVKVWWDDEKSKVREEYEGLTDMELQLLLAPDNVELLEQETFGQPEPPQAPMAPQGPPMGPQGNVDGAIGPGGNVVPNAPQGPPMAPQQAPPEPTAPTVTHNVAISRTGAQSGLKIENIPPEEFLISRKATSINNAPFCAHRTQMTLSDLKSMGFDVDSIDGYGENDGLQWEEEWRARYSYDNTDPESYLTNPADETMREVWVTEAYIRIDQDDDGIAELRKVVKVGSTILSNEEVECMPFASWTPIIISHKFYGLSEADLVMDLQRIQSQLFRNLLDNQYLTNNGRYAAVDGMVNMDDLLTSRPHGVVRIKTPNAVTRLDTPQLGQTAFNMLDYVDRLRERRTGVSERTQGLDPNALGPNTAATAVNQVMTASQQRIELIARVFGETGLTDLFRLMYKEVLQNQTAKDIFRLRDEYIEIDPSDWRERKDTSVVVGLGNGSKESEIMQLSQIVQTQQQLAQNPTMGIIVKPQNVYNAVEDQVKVFNKAAGGRYFTNPDSPESQQQAQQAQQTQEQEKQKQDQMLQMQVQLEQQRVQIEQMKAQTDQQYKLGSLQVDQENTGVDRDKNAITQENNEDKIALGTAELEMEYELERVQGRGVSLG
jgi:hypothetical protein